MPPVCRAQDHFSWRPEILDATIVRDRVRLEHLRHSVTCPLLVHDTLRAQLRDFVRLAEPSKKMDEDALEAETNRVLAGVALDVYGRWVYYPWSGRLVHVLPPEQFRLVRQDRNRHKITAEEQGALGRFVVGVVGLSVGNAVARTLALEGAAGRLRLADQDALDLSNLNRLQAGVHEVGLNKAVLAARQIYETDPYSGVEVFEDGLTAANIGRFILGPPRLDGLIDECDSIDMKLLLRERAREHRIPVLMATSDRGMLDVERFDLEPDRPILHGRVGDLRAADLAGLTTEQKVPYVLRILAPDELSARVAASMVEIGRTVTTWPQLASEVQLGGAVATTAIRYLALGLPLPSGRRYIGVPEFPAMPDRDADPAERRGEEGCCGSFPRPALRRATVAFPSHVRWLAQHAALAPSGGNCQPWRFAVGPAESLIIVHDEVRGRGLRDWRGLASSLAIGAAVENASVAAGTLGCSISATITPPRDGLPLSVRIALVADGGVDREAAAARLELVRSRSTNRKLGDGVPLCGDVAAELEGAADGPGTCLQLVAGLAQRREIGRILGVFDRLQFTTPALHREYAAEIRWTAEEAERTRDGIDAATFDLDPTKLAALRLVMRPDVASILRAPGRGRAIEEMAQDAMAASSAVGLLRTLSETPTGFVEAGRAMQRVWLRATRLGLGVQPWTALPFVARMLNGAECDTFDEREKAEVRLLSERLDSMFPDHRAWAHALLFRVSNADAPRVRSLRRNLDEIFDETRY